MTTIWKSKLEAIRVGIYEKALPKSVAWAERLTTARKAGYDFLEIAIDDSAERISRLDWSSSQRCYLRRSILDTGVPIQSMSLSAHRRFPLGSTNAQTRRTGLNILKKAIDFAAEMGLRYILIAGIDVYYEPSTSTTRALFLDGLEQGFLRASSAGVMLALENWDIHIHSLVDAVKLVGYFNSPWFQLYADIGNLVYAGHDVVTELKAARGHIAAVHLKDTLPGQLRYVPLGKGAVPFVKAFASLAETGYQGPMCVELWTENYPDSVDILIRGRKWLKKQMELGWEQCLQ